MAKEFYRRVADTVKELFDLKKLKGILVGGPGPTKDEFIEEGQLTTAIKEKIIAVKDIGYADEHGLKLLVDESQDILSKLEVIEEKKKLKEFFEALVKDKAVIGFEKVKKALSYGAADKVFVIERIDEKKLDEIKQLADSSNAEIVFVSKETDEGIQFHNISEVGAILRFKFE